MSNRVNGLAFFCLESAGNYNLNTQLTHRRPERAPRTSEKAP